MSSRAETLPKLSTGLACFAFRNTEYKTDKIPAFLASFVSMIDRGCHSSDSDDITPSFAYRKSAKKMALRVCVSGLFK